MVAFLAQGASMLISVIQSLIIPKVLSIDEFSYWQLFIFYIGYVGFFHLGLNDGVYLLKGGEGREAIDKSSVNSQFLFSVAFQSLFAITVIIAAAMGEIESSRFFVVVCTGVYLVVQNAASYFMFVLQAMNETRISSYSTIVARFSFLIPLCILIFMRISTFQSIVIAYIGSALLQLAYCAWYCRDILTSSFSGWIQAARESIASIRVGMKLMIANIAGQLILGVVRLIVDAAWGIEAFGKLSFALSLVNFFLAFVSQAAMVLFPALRQSDEVEIRSFYQASRDVLGILFPIIYLFYFPMVWLLSMWLPAYTESFLYFIWLIPICVFDSKMNITCTTLFKVRREESLLLSINIFTAAICTVMILFSVYYLNSIEAAIASTTAAIIGRSMYSERVVSSALGTDIDDVSLWEIALTIAFIAMALLLPKPIAFSAYGIAYAIFAWKHREQLCHIAHVLGKH